MDDFWNFDFVFFFCLFWTNQMKQNFAVVIAWYLMRQVGLYYENRIQFFYCSPGMRYYLFFLLLIFIFLVRNSCCFSDFDDWKVAKCFTWKFNGNENQNESIFHQSQFIILAYFLYHWNWLNGTFGIDYTLLSVIESIKVDGSKLIAFDLCFFF